MNVLIATDGSEFSRSAVEKYCDLFPAADARILLVSAVEPMTHIVGTPFGVVDNYYDRFIDAGRKRAAADLNSAKEVLIERLGPEVDVETECTLGSPARTIIEAADKWNANLVVVGSHGRGFWGRIYLGSVSNAVVRNAHCSVLVVREKAAEEMQT